MSAGENAVMHGAQRGTGETVPDFMSGLNILADAAAVTPGLTTRNIMQGLGQAAGQTPAVTTANFTQNSHFGAQGAAISRAAGANEAVHNTAVPRVLFDETPTFLGQQNHGGYVVQQTVGAEVAQQSTVLAAAKKLAERSAADVARYKYGYTWQQTLGEAKVEQFKEQVLAAAGGGAIYGSSTKGVDYHQGTALFGQVF